MRATLILLLWILTTPAMGLAQGEIRLSENESLRAEPAGSEIATLISGAELELGERDGRWQEVRVEGWIWAPSVRSDDRPGFDLVVAAQNGENLRATPNGRRIARLRAGMLLEELGREGRWVRVGRKGWIERDPEPTRPSEDEVGGVPERTLHQAPILDRTSGDTIATLHQGSAIELIEDQGEWVRVRVEGWIPRELIPDDTSLSAVITDLTPQLLASEPERFKGQVIEWEIQFIALDRAEEIRRDLEPGELFILARPPGDQPGFVYIAVPEDLVDQVQGLAPLERVRVRGRVRTGRSSQMAVPILDLIEIR